MPEITLEFENDSPNLSSFASQLTLIEFPRSSFHEEWCTPTVFQHADGRYFIVSTNQDRESMCGEKTKTASGNFRFCSWKRNFKSDQPYVVTFTQVTKHERQVTENVWKHNGNEVQT